MKKLTEKIKTNLDIVSVIGRYVDLKKAGRNYSGLCPFHPDTHPSFFVSPQLQAYHCFGCRRHGNVISFIMEKEGLTFKEALRHLAQEARIDIDELQKGIKRFRRIKSKEKEIDEMLESLRREGLPRGREILKKILWKLNMCKNGSIYLRCLLQLSSITGIKSEDIEDEIIRMPIKNDLSYKKIRTMIMTNRIEEDCLSTLLKYPELTDKVEPEYFKYEINRKIFEALKHGKELESYHLYIQLLKDIELKLEPQLYISRLRDRFVYSKE